MALGEVGRRRSGRRTAPGNDLLPLVPDAATAVPPPLRLEAAVTCAEPFDADDWWFTVDWEGMPVVARLDATGQFRLDDWAQRDRSHLFPEIRAAATDLGCRPMAVEGVVAALRQDGRPDLEALLRRIRGGPDVATGAAIVLLVTDLLWLDDGPTTAWPLERRYDRLRTRLPVLGRIQLPGFAAGHGRAFAAACAEWGLCGIVARRASAPYRCGVPSPDRLRIPLSPRLRAVVAGIVRGAPGGVVTGLVLSVLADGRWVDAGRVAVALSPDVEAWVVARAEELASRRVPGPRPGAIGVERRAAPGAERGEILWLRPGLVAEIDPGSAERAAVVTAIRDDLDPSWCVHRRPVPPPRDREVVRPFVPLVLPSLPLD